MRFPLADWIDDHDRCRHNLGSSGMRGSIRRPPLPDPGPEPPDAQELVEALARSVGVDASRLFLTHGATEGNAWVAFFLARARTGSDRACRVRFPEYPPLFDLARAAGWTVQDDARPAGLAVVSQPRNPEGDRWSTEALFGWADGARHLLVDETFREFARAPSFAAASRPHLWTTGTFTKFFGSDDLRVGFVVAPEEEAERFRRFIGLVSDEIPDRSVAGALELLRRIDYVRAEVDRVMDRNRSALCRALPGTAPPLAPVHFDRVRPEGGDRLARRCLAASVLVCPGSFFGEPGGVRIGLTRRTFPEDLAAYLRVRDRRGGAATAHGPTRGGRSARASTGRAMRTRG